MADNAIINKFVWQPETLGMDVPLSVSAVNSEQATVNYYYFTDANKNIGQLVDASGNIVAKYEYSPFGRIVSADGLFATANSFRFSSEYHDDETGLVYYNYRYYSPELGRWTKRDPIEEEGGINVYGIIYNKVITYYDIRGLIEGYSTSGRQDSGYSGMPRTPGWYNQYPSEEDAILKRRDVVMRKKRLHEFCGNVCKDCETGNYFTTQTRGTKFQLVGTHKKKLPDGTIITVENWEASCRPSMAACPPGSTKVRTWHSHPRDGSAYPSDADIQVATETQQTQYLIGPGGELILVYPSVPEPKVIPPKLR